MTKEDYVLLLQVLTEYPKESRKIKKLKDKISIFVERFNLDDDYQKNMMALAERLQNLEPKQDDKCNN